MAEYEARGDAAFALSATTLLMLEAKGILARADVLRIFAQAAEICADGEARSIIERALAGLTRNKAG